MRSPLLGYNTNVRHHGKLFHIQTEDSGATHGHIFTHLFADGGRIIATKKSTYAQWVETERYPDVVKKLMQAQHKAMFIALRDGLFDEDEAAGAREFAAREIRLEEELVPPIEIDVEVLDKAAEGFVSKAAEPERPRGEGEAPRPAAARGPAPPPIPQAARSRRGARNNVTASFAATRPGEFESIQGSEARAPRADETERHATGTSPGAAPAPGSGQPDQGSRYQSTRSAAPSRGKSRSAESVFGADFLSEKSLDEVIMSYLAEDLDETE